MRANDDFSIGVIFGRVDVEGVGVGETRVFETLRVEMDPGTETFLCMV